MIEYKEMAWELVVVALARYGAWRADEGGIVVPLGTHCPLLHLVRVRKQLWKAISHVERSLSKGDERGRLT